MNSKQRTLAAAILLAVTGVVLLVLAAWPLPKRTITNPFPPAYSLDFPEMQPLVLERENSVLIPEKLRTGQPAIVKFTSNGDKTAAAVGNGKPEEASSLLEARLEIPGMAVEPGDSILQPVAAEVDLHYSWEILAYEKGTYQGTLWIYLLVPVNSGERLDRRPVQALPFEIQAAGIPSTGLIILRITAIVLLMLACFAWLKGYTTSIGR